MLAWLMNLGFAGSGTEDTTTSVIPSVVRRAAAVAESVFRRADPTAASSPRRVPASTGVIRR